MPAGRPTLYTTELIDEICERIMDGESLNKICREEKYPRKATLFRWLYEKPEFNDLYRKARAAQAELLADELMEIADDGTNDYMENVDNEGAIIGYKLNGENINRSKLRVDARKWIAARLLPRIYGDKVALTDPDGGSLKVVIQKFSDIEKDEKDE